MLAGSYSRPSRRASSASVGVLAAERPDGDDRGISVGMVCAYPGDTVKQQISSQ